MPPSSNPIDGTARRNERAILRALASVGQSPIAAELNVSESTVSRWKDGEIQRFARFCALLGLKLTPLEYRCYDQKTLDAMLTFARQRMEQLEGVEDLVAPEDES